MPLYYQGPDAIVTDEVFEVRYPCLRRFPVSELACVYVVRHPLDRVVVVSAYAAAATLLLVAASWSMFRSSESWLFAALLVMATSLATGVFLRLRPRVQELRAVYRSHDVSLYLSGDGRRFGQVRRALTRALDLKAAQAVYARLAVRQ